MVKAMVWAVAGLSLAAVAVVGCKSDDAKAKAEEKTLFVRLGGEDAIKAVVTELLLVSTDNPKVNFSRKGVPGAKEGDPSGHKCNAFGLITIICHATGGGDQYAYEGKPLEASHAELKINDAEFDALAGDLISVLKKMNVPQKESDELVAIVASLRPKIVTRS